MSAPRYMELPSSPKAGQRRAPFPYWWAVKICLLIILILAVFAFIDLSWTSREEAVRKAEEMATERSTTKRRRTLKIRPGYQFLPPISGKFACPAESLRPTPKGPPTDVNRVRPADITYIGALGDSITTGYLSVDSLSNFYDIVNNDDDRNYVGNSFDAGGNDGLESHVSIPTIFRSLNSALVGYSHGKGLEEKTAGLNVAYPGRWSNDFPRQASLLVKRMNSEYTKESIKSGWKLVNFFIGTNDIMGMCRTGTATTKDEYKSFLREAIEIIQSSLPRTIVSLIGMWDVNFTILATQIIHKEPMGCLEGFEKNAQKRIEEYRKALVELSEESRLQKEDFAVVVQTLFDDLREPLKMGSGEYNINFYATDTFHLSKYGNSVVAKALWKQLISPVGQKNTTALELMNEMPELACPDKECPYIRTISNSRNCTRP